MPTVPSYGDPKVSTEALPGVRQTFNPGNPGAAIGAGLEKLGSATTQIALDEKKRQSEIAVLEADRKLSSWTTDTLYNPETGAMNLQGKDSFGLPDKVMPAFDKTVNDIQSSLTNDAQRETFQKLAATRRKEVDLGVTKHVAGEMRKFEDSELQAYTQNAHDAALANPDAAGNEITRQQMAISSYAQRNGMGPEWTKLKIGETVSNTHLGVVDGLLAQGRDQQAQAYYQANSNQFLAEDKTRAEKALDVGTLRGSSQRAADAITTTYNDPTAMMAAVEQIKDPKLRDATEERVQRKIRFLSDVNKKAIDQAFSSAWSIVDQTGDLNNVPPAVLGQLGPTQRTALKKYEKQIATGADVVNNDPKWLEFLALKDQELNKMSEADLLSKYIPEFDKAHRERAMTRWGNVRDAANGNKTAAAHHAATKSFDDIVSTTLSTAGIGLPVGYGKADVKKLSDEKQQVVAQFETQADIAIKQYEANDLGGKRAANSEEMQKIVDGLLLKKVFVENKIFPGGQDRPAAVLTASEAKRVKTQDAPQDPQKRVAGEAYNTPKGVLTWTGTGWLKN